ncbi:hypothetical protein WNY98_19740 [Pseudoalteromonas sp. AS71]|uniref:hypothetical protein n=1 Tax=Pseudoalteromonas sp. AS71 TaxID=3135777 RepID=UPI00316D0A18
MKKGILLLIVFAAGCASNGDDNSQSSSSAPNNWYNEHKTPMHVGIAWKGQKGANELLQTLGTCDKTISETQRAENYIEAVSYLNSVKNDKNKLKQAEIDLVNKKNALIKFAARGNNSSTKCYLDTLTESESTLVIRDATTGAEINSSIASTSYDGRDYEIAMKWSKHTWMLEPTFNEKLDELKAFDESVYKVGVGVNIVAKIYNAKAGLDLTNLPALAFQIKNTETKGTISFNRIGINGKVTELIFPSASKDLSPETLSQAIGGLQKIQILLYTDDDIVLKPTVLGYMNPNLEINTEDRAWLYIGHYPDANQMLSEQFKITASDNNLTVANLLGETIKVTVNRSLRADRPRFPTYSIPKEKMFVSSGCTLKVLQLVSVGFDKYWALVNKTDKDSCKAPK